MPARMTPSGATSSARVSPRSDGARHRAVEPGQADGHGVQAVGEHAQANRSGRAARRRCRGSDRHARPDTDNGTSTPRARRGRRRGARPAESERRARRAARTPQARARWRVRTRPRLGPESSVTASASWPGAIGGRPIERVVNQRERPPDGRRAFSAEQQIGTLERRGGGERAARRAVPTAFRRRKARRSSSGAPSNASTPAPAPARWGRQQVRVAPRATSRSRPP